MDLATTDKQETRYQSILKHLYSTNDSSRYRIQQCLKILRLEKFISNVPVIHVTGSKGKGSTAIFTAALIHELHNLKVGVYTSPHIQTVRERIMFDGFKPVDKQTFIETYEYCLKSLPNLLSSRLGYHELLFLVALQIFESQRVDLLVIEVHIGGLNDTTRIFSNTKIVAITNITLEHSTKLGKTKRDILSNKLGLVMPTTVAVISTVSTVNKYLDIFDTLPIKAKVYTVRETFKTKMDYILRLAFEFASVIESIFCQRYSPHKLINEDWFYRLYLRNKIPARRQIISNLPNICWYIDGAHTPESFDATVTWYNQNVCQLYRVCMFTLTGDRNFNLFETAMARGNFDVIIFTVPIAYSDHLESEQHRVVENALHFEYAKQTLEHAIVCHQKCTLLQKYKNVVSCTNNAVNKIEALQREHGVCAVLVTGSLYLCSATLAILEKMQQI